MTVFWVLSGVPSRKSSLLSCLMWNVELLCLQCSRIGPHLVARGMSPVFSLFAAGTRGILSSYDWDGDSRLMFIWHRQDSCLVASDTSRFFSRLGRAIGTPLELRRETQDPFPVATVIFGFLSIFKRSQALSPFEAFNPCTSWTVKGI